jgi:hypothetical protein
MSNFTIETLIFVICLGLLNKCRKKLLNNREVVFSAWSVPRGYRGTEKLFGEVVEHWVEFWRRQLKVIEKK